MADFNPNLWAPWRMEYIRTLQDEGRDVGCFLCYYWQNPDEDRANRVLLRGPNTFAVMNLFPYTNGHLLISPSNHEGEFGGLTDETLLELATMSRDAMAILAEAVHPQGFNLGYNIGRCAGAGLPNHIHNHVVPRWNGDTNYMTTLGGVRVVPDGLDTTYQQLVEAAERLGLRDRPSS